jgi:hypothetical protein
LQPAVAAEGLGIELRNTGFCALYICTKPLSAESLAAGGRE